MPRLLGSIALMSSILHHTNLSNNVSLHSVLSSDVPQGTPRATGVNLYLGPYHVTSELGGATRGPRCQMAFLERWVG
uniref:Putative secreted protein n=1 Tax=Ixodes ricinus TaxID=34613 RepID=A0A6B0U4Q9_IXORI